MFIICASREKSAFSATTPPINPPVSFMTFFIAPISAMARRFASSACASAVNAESLKLSLALGAPPGPPPR
jgi:hypothetical protein